MKKEALRVVSTVPVAPTTLYFAWLSSDQHAAMTGGGTAKIEPTVGSKYSAWNGYITGKLVVLDLGRRIVMSWRTTDFPRDAADSRVEVHFEALGGSTRVTILHTDIPEGQAEKYKQGWNDNYFTPMRTYFSKYLPDPRKPLPPRRSPPPPAEEESTALSKLKKRAAAAKGLGPTVAKAPPSKKVVAPPAPPMTKPTKTVAAKAPPAKNAAAPKPAPAPAKKAPAAKKPPPTKKAAAAKKPAASKKPTDAKKAAKKTAKPAPKKKKK